MSRYLPGTIATADKAVAVLHSVGGEKKLWATRVPAVERGSIFLAANASGVWTPDAIFGGLPTTGVDLQVKVDGDLQASAAAVLTVIGTDTSDLPLTGTATLSPPSWVRNNADFNFPEGIAFDVVPNITGSTQKYKTILANGIAITNAQKWSRLKIFSLPVDTDWQYIEKVETVRPNIGIQPPHAIPDGLDGAAQVTKGRSEPGNVSISALHRSVVDGLQRYAGVNCCLKLEVWRQGNVLVERHVFANCILGVNPDFPDGSEDAKQAGDGMMQDFFAFVAP